MDNDRIDLDRVIHDPEYRRFVIEQLKAKAATEIAASPEFRRSSDSSAPRSSE